MFIRYAIFLCAAHGNILGSVSNVLNNVRADDNNSLLPDGSLLSDILPRTSSDKLLTTTNDDPDKTPEDLSDILSSLLANGATIEQLVNLAASAASILNFFSGDCGPPPRSFFALFHPLSLWPIDARIGANIGVRSPAARCDTKLNVTNPSRLLQELPEPLLGPARFFSPEEPDAMNDEAALTFLRRQTVFSDDAALTFLRQAASESPDL